MKKALKIVDSINLKMCYVAMAALFFLMCMTTVDTIARKIPTLGGIPDSMDLTEIGMVFIVFCGLAFLESERGHIRVDMFLNMFPKLIKRILESFLYILSAFILFLLFYAMFDKIFSTMKSGAATQLLHIPQWPFVIVVTAAIFLFAFTVLMHAVEVIAGKVEEPKEEEA